MGEILKSENKDLRFKNLFTAICLRNLWLLKSCIQIQKTAVKEV